MAITTRVRVHLAPAIAALPSGHPRLRFVAALCLYGKDLDMGLVPGPYDEREGEFYARTLLIPDEEFERFRHERDGDLAARLHVPLEQIVAKRADLHELLRSESEDR